MEYEEVHRDSKVMLTFGLQISKEIAIQISR